MPLSLTERFTRSRTSAILPGGQPRQTSQQREAALVKSRPQFIEELKKIPNDEKGGYLEALKTVPALVEKETPIDRFLICEAYEAEPAARRFVEYWNNRIRLFGAERALRPMRMENGALNPSDFSVLKGGHAYPLLPDEQGRFVIAMESSYVPPAVSDIGMNRLRTLFYLLHVASLADDYISQEEGIVGLYIFGRSVFDDRSIAFGLEILGDCIPIRVHCVHVACLPYCPNMENLFERVLPVVIRLGGEFHGNGKLYTLQIGNLRPEIADQLRSRNQFKHPHGIPAAVGGTYGEKERKNWIKKQAAREEKLYSAGNSPANYAKLTGSPTCLLPPASSTTGVPVTKTERDARNGIKQSRKKRIKQRARMEALEIQVKHLEVNNSRFKSENAILAGFVTQAEQMVQGQPTFEELQKQQQQFAATAATMGMPNLMMAGQPAGAASVSPGLFFPSSHFAFANQMQQQQQFQSMLAAAQQQQANQMLMAQFLQMQMQQQQQVPFFGQQQQNGMEQFFQLQNPTAPLQALVVQSNNDAAQSNPPATGRGTISDELLNHLLQQQLNGGGGVPDDSSLLQQLQQGKGAQQKIEHQQSPAHNVGSNSSSRPPSAGDAAATASLGVTGVVLPPPSVPDNNSPAGQQEQRDVTKRQLSPTGGSQPAQPACSPNGQEKQVKRPRSSSTVSSDADLQQGFRPHTCRAAPASSGSSQGQHQAFQQLQQQLQLPLPSPQQQQFQFFGQTPTIAPNMFDQAHFAPFVFGQQFSAGPIAFQGQQQQYPQVVAVLQVYSDDTLTAENFGNPPVPMNQVGGFQQELATSPCLEQMQPQQEQDEHEEKLPGPPSPVSSSTTQQSRPNPASVLSLDLADQQQPAPQRFAHLNDKNNMNVFDSSRYARKHRS